MIDKLTQQITDWAKARELDRAEPSVQMIKTMEELGELAGALIRGNEAGILDGIGDVYVTLVVLCTQLGIQIEDAITYAYGEIANRTGEMRNGAFVKTEDL